MTIDELVRRTLRDWSDEARVPSDLASRVLRRRRRARVRAFAVVAGATAAVVAGALTVPALVQGEQVDDSRPAVVVMTDPSPSTETVGDPDSVRPTTLVAAGDTAIYAYFTMSQVKESGGRRVLKRTWRLYDKDKKVYEQTPWAWLDVAGGGESIAVLERVAARRVGVTGSRGGAVRWIELERLAGAVRWSPDGRRLLVTNYDGDPDEAQAPASGGRRATSPSRTGYTVIDLESGRAGFHPVGQPDRDLMTLGRLDFSWSADGTLVWEPGVDPSATKKFYDLEGNPRPAPPEVARTYQEAGMSPGGRWVATGTSDTIATMAVKNVSTGQVKPLRPVGGYRIERLAAWADEGHLFAWACELKGIQSCSISDFRTRLILVDVDGGKTVPLSAYRSSTNDPGTWTPVFSRR